ncbi:LYR motif-containing protein [Phanerochaete sordida]|uniref:LYR motif-containing protein 2 n=1 Tax=Phanerochaete sordida TaxID=48140 RepID=A0A9P3G1N4_9APHY|nr:LYR motif-containing protein [Phanerochaete sordida]
MAQLTLKHFILKQRVINLYRQAVRACRTIPDLQTRQETLVWIRSEFERNRYISDTALIEDKLSAGYRELRRSLPGMHFSSSHR